MDELEEVINDIMCSTFHMNDEQAKSIIDEYLNRYPKLLEIHEREWYYKNC